MVATYVALLRSINVGGRNRVPMADLRALVGEAGFDDVTTYLQSGNVVFTGKDGKGAAAAAGRAIGTALTAELGVTVPIVVRIAAELGKVVRSHPFADPGIADTLLHVTFLDRAPSASAVDDLTAMAGRFGDDRCAVDGREVYLYCPGGYGQTTLNNAWLERRLDRVGTTRNWRTVTTLASMAGVAEGPSRPR